MSFHNRGRRANMKILLLVIVMVVPAMAMAQSATPTGNPESGKRVFMKQNCYYCHGTTGQGGRDGARLAQTALNVQGLIRYVRKPTGGMPAFTEKILSDQELTDIYAYLKSLPAAKAPKDIPLMEQIK